MTIYAMAERLGRAAKQQKRQSLIEIIQAELDAVSEARAVDRDIEARRLISLLMDRTNSASEHEACKRWLEARS